MFLLLVEPTSQEVVMELAEFISKFMFTVLPIPLALSLIVFTLKLMGATSTVRNNHSSSNEVVPKIGKQVLKELPEWKHFEKVNIKLRESLKNWDKKTIEEKCPEISSIIAFNYKTYTESIAYLNEFGVSKEVSFIFLQNDQLLQRLVEDLKKQPKGESRVLMHLHIKMAKELATINKQLEGAMENHINSLDKNYLNEEKISKQDLQNIIETRNNLAMPNNTNYDPFFKE